MPLNSPIDVGEIFRDQCTDGGESGSVPPGSGALRCFQNVTSTLPCLRADLSRFSM